MREVSTWIVIVVSFIIMVISGYKLVQLVALDYNQYTAESECASKYTKRGVERNSIQTGNGTCWIK